MDIKVQPIVGPPHQNNKVDFSAERNGYRYNFTAVERGKLKLVDVLIRLDKTKEDDPRRDNYKDKNPKEVFVKCESGNLDKKVEDRVKSYFKENYSEDIEIEK